MGPAFLDAWRSANVQQGLPDFKLNVRDVSVCPYDLNRVWFTVQPTGTHTATLRLGEREHAATGRRWESPPERCSLTFDGEGRCIAMTAGYVMDRRMGNT